MAICNRCRKRLIFWTTLTIISIGTGLLLDLVFLKTHGFPLSVRLTGLTGVVLTHFILKRTGRLLRQYGECELWGWSTRLIVKNVYKCVRHPHHMGVGTFMTFFALLIGYPVTFFIIVVTQWLWVFLFILYIEEKECFEKFGNEYREYQKKVPMFFGNPFCIIKEILKPINE
jgi:protein-S-isoprenylcysteine O-methyltransferase Ste14